MRISTRHAAADHSCGGAQAFAARFSEDVREDRGFGRASSGGEHADDPRGRAGAFSGLPAADGRGDEGIRRSDHWHPGEPENRRHTLDHKGAVDVAYIMPDVARFRTNIFHSREKFAIVMRRIVTKIPQFRRPESSAAGGRDGRSPSRDRHRVRHNGVGEIDDAGGDHRQDQPHPLRTDHHGRRPHRIPARERQEPGQPGGSGHGQREL